MSSSEDESFKETVATSSINSVALKAFQIYETGISSSNKFSTESSDMEVACFTQSTSEPVFKNPDSTVVWTVDEEDEYLYNHQDSTPNNSLSIFLLEEPKCVDGSEIKDEKQLDWSEDEYDEPFSSMSPEIKLSCQEQEINFSNVKVHSILKETIPIEKMQQLPSSTQSSSILLKDLKKVSKSKFEIVTQSLNINDSKSECYPNVEKKLSCQSTLSSRSAEISIKEKPKLGTEMSASNSTKPLEHMKNPQPMHIHPKRRPGKECVHYKSENLKHLSPKRNFDSMHKNMHQSTYHKKYESRNKDFDRNKYRSSGYKNKSTYKWGSRDRSYDVHRQYSHSSVIRSREKSPEHFRKKNSAGLHSSRKSSRSPSYLSSSYTNHEYKFKKYSMKRSVRSPDQYYPKRRRKSQDSNDDPSFSSSLSDCNSGSNSDSSTSSKKSAKIISEELPKNKANNESKRVAIVDSEVCFNAIPAKSDNVSLLSEDRSKNTPETNKSNEEDICSIFKLIQRGRLLSENYQDVQQENSSLISFNKPVTNITNIGQTMSSSQMPITISDSQSYPVISSVPMPYCSTAVSDSPMYNPHTTLSTIDPSITVENNVDRPTNQTRKPQTFKMSFRKRSPTLRKIELDPGNRITRSSPIESSELKENDIVSPILSTVNVNSEQIDAFIEEYKEMKYEWHLSDCSKKNSNKGLIEMKRLMQEVWEKFHNPSANREPNIHLQCVEIFNVCTSMFKQCSTNIMCLEKKLDKLKAQHSLEELARIENEFLIQMYSSYIMENDFKNLLEYSALMKQRRKEYKLAAEKKEKVTIESTKQSKTKEAQKIVYIGKSPCYKKEKFKPKRKNILNKDNSESGITESPHAKNAKEGKTNQVDKILKTLVQKTTSIKANPGHFGNNCKKTLETSNIKNKNLSYPKKANQNQLFKIILSGTPHQRVGSSKTVVSKIDIAQSASVSFHPTLQSGYDNTLVPMDINSSWHSDSIPKLVTEENEYSVLADKRDLKQIKLASSSNADETATYETLMNEMDFFEKLMSEYMQTCKAIHREVDTDEL